jgi:uncharacterized protein (DUF362 family)
MKKVIVKEFIDYDSTVFKILDELNFADRLKDINKIIIKPNLLQDTPPPCTTDVNCVEAIIKFIRENSENTEVIILEGSGGCSTRKSYKVLGYEKISSIYDVRLLDVDEADIITLQNPDAKVYKEIHLPKIIFEGFMVSAPCLKDHLITGVTLSLKNLIGLLPEKYYGSYWSYKRSDVHRVGVSRAIIDLSKYINIDLSIVDGRIGQQGSHLAGGRYCDPAKNIIIGGYDALEVDKKGAEILGHDWKDIEHLRI